MKTFLAMSFLALGICQIQTVLSVTLDIANGQTTGPPLVGMSMSSTYTDQGGTGPCSKGVVIKVDFSQSPCNNSNHLECGHRTPQLVVVVHLDREGSRSDWIVNIGDSISNNGHGGDGGHNDNAAEIQAEATGTYDITSWKRGGNVCQFAKAAFKDYNIVGPSVNNVTFYVADRSYRVTNDRGIDATHCSECLFALDGQPDTKGGDHRINYEIYLSFNRVISSSSRKGHGVCSVDLQWECNQIPQDTSSAPDICGAPMENKPNTILTIVGMVCFLYSQTHVLWVEN
ncbi:uncharacterized protein LOC110458607 [Mizuhopecten yessoensis]|uniref:Uncharacterized protein n=1 Tax=Mizuhopecten yessoensis TaxID=6573 RepID=A0A210Q6F1_MIZYE|nr:uncharacterized protein LOC110458607 [Mizuhopecten yessoensis]XP_021366060.1 uncharacterized protein LOC110458607 [Mizuhopecten yessoensis]XP_021366061.1 uncharacterized protein LOC110458607 [Mizuhopecten yessoensis]OWF44313.1 hypothetical protein KP79_PYT15846 [Mizuhopecten yessoensis]